MPITAAGALIPADALMKVQMFCWFNSQISVNSWAYRVTTDDPDQRTSGQMAEKFYQRLRTPYTQAIGVGAIVLGTKVTMLRQTPAASPGIFQEDAGADTESPPITSGVTGLIRFNTRVAGGSGRGRCFMPFLPREDVVATGEISPRLKGVYEEIKDLLVSFASTTINGVLYDLEMRIDSLTYGRSTQVISGRVEDLVATQRRRAARGKQNLPIIV